MNEIMNFPFRVSHTEGEGCLVNSTIYEHAMEVVEIMEGKITVEIGSDRFLSERGDIFYIPSGLVRRIYVPEGRGAIRMLAFDSSIVEQNMDTIDTEILYMFEVQSRNRLSSFRKEHPVYEELSRYIREAVDESAAKDVCYKLPIRANIYLIMTSLLRYYCSMRTESDRMVYHNVLRLRPVLDYIDAHSHERIYVEKLAAMIMVSPDYFTKMFRESIGKTPVDYINDLRVNRALVLLCQGDLNMTQIAQQVGFSNVNYFHKMFKQYMGVSPMAYRKNVENTEK